MSGKELAALLEEQLRREELLANDLAAFIADGGGHGVDFYALPGLPRRYLSKWTPARVLREIAAKRRVIGLYTSFAASAAAQQEVGGDIGGGTWAAVKVLEETLKALAGVYEGRAGGDDGG